MIGADISGWCRYGPSRLFKHDFVCIPIPATEHISGSSYCLDIRLPVCPTRCGPFIEFNVRLMFSQNPDFAATLRTL